MTTSCGVGHRRGSDLALLWLCCRPAAAALIQPLAWELPYVGAALKSKEEKNNNKIISDPEVLFLIHLFKIFILATFLKFHCR